MAKSYGYIKPVIESDHYILGGGQLPQVILQPDGQWDNFLPEDEYQNIPFETDNCTGFGTTNAIENLMFKVFGTRLNYSDRALGVFAGTCPPGADPHAICETARKQGLVPESLLPFSNLQNVDEYYSFKGADEKTVRDAGSEWLQNFDFGHEWVFNSNSGITQEERVNNMKIALKYSPLCASVYAWAMGPDGMYIDIGEENHWIMIYGFTDKAWKIFDSYDNTHKLYDMANTINFCKRFHIEKKDPEETKKVNSILIVMTNFIPATIKQIKALVALIVAFLVPAPTMAETPIVAPPVAKETPQQMVLRVCKEKGLTAQQTNNLCNTIQCESGFDNDIEPHLNKSETGKVMSIDYGICQINDFYHIGPNKDFPSVQYVLDNPEKVVRWMCDMCKAGKLNLWVCWEKNLVANKKYV